MRSDGENEILKALDTALLDAASLIAPVIEAPVTHSGPGPGRTDGRPTIVDTLKTAELFVPASDDALASARTRTSGEAGLIRFLTLAVFSPANRLLRQFEPCLPAHHWLQWRAVGRGTAGKPDFELVLFARYPGTSRIYEKVLARIECKTTDTLPDAQLASLPDQVQEGFFSGPDDVWREHSIGHADPMQTVTVQVRLSMPILGVHPWMQTLTPPDNVRNAHSPRPLRHHHELLVMDRFEMGHRGRLESVRLKRRHGVE